MKKLMIIFAVAITACTNQVRSDRPGDEGLSKNVKSGAAVSFDSSRKWKADEATMKNVSAMLNLINDTNYRDIRKRGELSAGMQIKIDTLISQCLMKGEEHEALHEWLEKVLKELDELKKEKGEYTKNREGLKKDIESFYARFE